MAQKRDGPVSARENSLKDFMKSLIHVLLLLETGMLFAKARDY